MRLRDRASTTRTGDHLASPEVARPQASLFSAVSSAFTVLELKLDPNVMSDAHKRTLINVVSSSLSPNADPDSATRAEPPPGVVTVQSPPF